MHCPYGVVIVVVGGGGGDDGGGGGVVVVVMMVVVMVVVVVVVVLMLLPFLLAFLFGICNEIIISDKNVMRTHRCPPCPGE